MLSKPKAAKALGITVNTLTSWEDKGFIKAVYVTPTRRRFYSEEDIIKLIDRGYQIGSSVDKTI